MKRTIFSHEYSRYHLIVHHQAQVRPAHPEGIHLAIQFLILERGRFHIPVGADAFNADILTQ